MSSVPPAEPTPEEPAGPAPVRRPLSNPARPAPGAPYETIDDDATQLSDEEREFSAPMRAEGAGRREVSFYLAISPPTITYAFIIANLITFALSIVVGWWLLGIFNGFESIEVLVLMGAKVNELIVMGQSWRLFTSMFLHVGILHLVFNVYAIYAIGPLVEGYYGHLRYAVIYLVGGLVGSLASFAFSPSISAGASGAVFAIAAAAAVYFFRYRENFGERGRAILQNMIFVLGANLVFGLASQGIDNWGHFGGMLGGLLLGWLLLPRYPRVLVEPGLTGPLPIVADAQPLRVLAVLVASLALIWLGMNAASAHWQCGSWFGC